MSERRVSRLANRRLQPLGHLTARGVSLRRGLPRTLLEQPHTGVTVPRIVPIPQRASADAPD
jgi:hypothetical protein